MPSAQVGKSRANSWFRTRPKSVTAPAPTIVPGNPPVRSTCVPPRPLA